MADLTQTAANVSLTDVTGVVLSPAKAGEAITQGNPVYLSNGKYYKADSATAASAKAKGIALTPAATDEQFALAASGTTVDVGATLTIGETYCVSATSGAIAPIADIGSGEFPTILGTATATGKLPLNIVPATVAKP